MTDGLTLAAILTSDELGPEEKALAGADKEAFGTLVPGYPRQQRVVAVGAGHTFAAIAAQLGIAPSTAKELTPGL